MDRSPTMCTAAGRDVQQYAGRLSKHRLEGATGGREWPFHPSSRPQAEYPAPEQRGGKGCSRHRAHQYQHGTRDFTTVLTAEQNFIRPRTISPSLQVIFDGLGLGLPRPRRRLADPGWQWFPQCGDAEEMRNRTDWGGLLPPSGEGPSGQRQVCLDQRTGGQRSGRRNGEG